MTPRSAPGYMVPDAGEIQPTLVPDAINLTVGDTQPIQARGSNGQPVTGLTWISSDTNVVGLSTSDPLILTAVAPGRATITAGSASADVTVFSGPHGHSLWRIARRRHDTSRQR